jgi:hypothetical protein
MLAAMRYTGRYVRATRVVVWTATAWLGGRSYIELVSSVYHHNAQKLMQIVGARPNAQPLSRALGAWEICCQERPSR